MVSSTRRRERIGHTLVGVALAVVAAFAVVPAGTATAAPGVTTHDNVAVGVAPIVPVLPEQDPAFYSPPQSVVETKKPGQIISARRVTIANLSLIPIPVDAWQVSYRSTDTHGTPIAAVTTLLKPRSARTPDGKPRRLLVFNSATDGLARYCDPSYQYQFASVPWQLSGSAAVGNEILQAQAALAQGWTVSVPDVQGPKSAYAAGPLQGRIALDSARAAQRFAPLGLQNTTRVGLVGYSGGAIATNWAGELAASYAPDLDIAGIASGGSQPELDKTLNMAEGQATAGLIFAAVIGLGREYPQLSNYIDKHITPEGRALLGAKDNLCLTYSAMLVPFLQNKTLLRGGDPLRAPDVAAVIAKTRMGSTAPRAPLFQFHSRGDWIAPIGPVNAMVAKYCAAGADVTYLRDRVSEHITLDVAATPTWMMWMRDRFNGVPPQKGCSIRDVDSVTLDQRTWPVWVNTVGDVLAGVFQKPLGVK